MSYEVRINGEPVDLPPATPVKLDWQSPYLLYDTIPGSQDNLPAFPATERNQRIFGYFHEPQSGPRIAEFTCQQFYGGELLKEGYFILTDADLATGYKGIFSDKLGEFFGDYQNVLLSELELGELPLELPTSGEVYQSGQLAYVLPTIVNSDFYGGNNPPGFSGRVNDYQAGQYVENSPRVPLFMVSFVLSKIAQLTGTTIEGEFFEHESWSRLAIYNTRAVQTGNVLVSGHLPDLTIQQFLLELRKLPNLAFTFDSPRKRLRIDFWEKKLALPTSLDWTKKAERGEVKTAERNARLQLSYELDSGDALQKDKPAAVADYFSPLLPDDGRNGLAKLTPCKFSTLLTDEETGLATSKQKGNTSEYGQGSEKFSPRLLFWHGLQDGVPRALPGHGSISLYWNGENGLAATSWKNTEAFRRNWFYLKKDFVLTESDLAQLDFSRKIHVDGMDYIIASLSVSLPIKQAASTLLLSC